MHSDDNQLHAGPPFRLRGVELLFSLLSTFIKRLSLTMML